MKLIATYRRVSTEEQARNTEAYERQKWQLDQELAKYPDRQFVNFEDIQSGRRDDRPDMIKLILAIESDTIDVLIVTRIDRIGRDLEANARLQKQLERKGVRVFETLLGRFLDWVNPNDWSYFCNAGLDGEKESRMLSARIKQTFEWHRSQGKMGGGRVGFPYRRNDQGYIEPDPEQWSKGIECIKICCANNGASMAALGKIRELGIDRTRAWLSHWIRSPLLRGHTPQDTRQLGGNKRKRSDITIVYDTHTSIFDDPQLAGYGYRQQLDNIISDSARIKGSTRQHPIYPLSGLVYCGRCGSTCHIKSISNSKYPDKKYTYVMCGNRAGRGIACGGEYGAMQGHRKSINNTYEAIEDQVILALTERASQLIDLAIATEPTDLPDHPDVARLRAEIEKLKSFSDPDLDSAIAKKTAQLNRLLLVNPVADVSTQQRDEFVDLFTDPMAFIRMPLEERRKLYREWVHRVDVDRQQIDVRLTIEPS